MGQCISVEEPRLLSSSSSSSARTRVERMRDASASSTQRTSPFITVSSNKTNQQQQQQQELASHRRLLSQPLHIRLKDDFTSNESSLENSLEIPSASSNHSTLRCHNLPSVSSVYPPHSAVGTAFACSSPSASSPSSQIEKRGEQIATGGGFSSPSIVAHPHAIALANTLLHSPIQDANFGDVEHPHRSQQQQRHLHHVVCVCFVCNDSSTSPTTTIDAAAQEQRNNNNNSISGSFDSMSPFCASHRSQLAKKARERFE